MQRAAGELLRQRAREAPFVLHEGVEVFMSCCEGGLRRIHMRLLLVF